MGVAHTIRLRTPAVADVFRRRFLCSLSGKEYSLGGGTMIDRFKLALILSVSLLAPSYACAQTQRVFDDKIVLRFDSILEEWNKEELKLPSKADLEPRFFRSLEQRMTNKPGGYED